MGFLSYIYTAFESDFLPCFYVYKVLEKIKMPRSIGVLLGESINFKCNLKLINMTNLQNCLDNCSVYCGTYHKYNNSSLYGKWLNLSDYSSYEELQEAMRELHKDEHDPEFMLSDYEHCELFERLGLIS